jgi:triacylglycerol lipase
MGYRHCGHEVYLDRRGRIRKLTGVWRSRDRWRGLIGGLIHWKLDMLADHSIRLYAQHITAAVDKELRSLASGQTTTDVDDLVIRDACEGQVGR